MRSQVLTLRVPLFVIAASLVGCATPSPLVRLNPTSQDVVWVSGRASGNSTIASASLMQSDAAVHDSRLASISVQRSTWSNEALRRNTLLPGQGTGGRVYLPINLNAGVVWLHVRTNGQAFSFPFQQVVTNLTRPTQTALNRR